MKISFFKSILIFLFLISSLSAQGETAFPFLTFPISPNSMAMGGTGSALFSNDEFRFLHNPAWVAPSSLQNKIGINYNPSKSINSNFFETTVVGGAININYNLQEEIGIGFGVVTGKMKSIDREDKTLGLESLLGEDKYTAVSIGTSFDLGIMINGGLSLKFLNSVIYPYRNGQEGGSGLYYSSTVLDYGIAIKFPFNKLFNYYPSIDLFQNLPLQPFVNLTVGYSILNVGGEVYYIDKKQSDPLPRTERVGYSISIGFESQLDGKKINILGFDFTVDAENSLVSIMNITPPPNVRSLPQYEYESILGEINIFKNLIGVKGDENVIIHTGFNITLFETLSILRGHFSGRYMGLNKSNGFIVHSDGAFKLLSNVTDLSTLHFFFDNFYLKYYTANYLVDQPFETKFNSISFGYKGPLL